MITKIWNKKDNLIFPNGVELTPEEVFSDQTFGWTRHAEVLIQMTPKGVTHVIDDIDVLKGNYGIDDSLYGEEAVAAIEAVKKEQEEQAAILAGIPSAEERIAAALEFQNLMETDCACFDCVCLNFDKGLWTEQMVHKAVEKGAITEEQYQEIVSKDK